MTLHPIDLDLDHTTRRYWGWGLQLKYLLINVMDEGFVAPAYNHHCYHIVMLF